MTIPGVNRGDITKSNTPTKAIYTHYVKSGANTTLAQVNRKRDEKLRIVCLQKDETPTIYRHFLTVIFQPH